MARKLKSQTRALITGASTGIGRDLALLLALRYGARLVLNARNRQALEKTAADVKAAGGEATLVVGDVCDPAVIAELVESGLNKFNGLDILINNAGFAKPGPMLSISLEDWRQVFEVNFFAPLTLTYKLLPAFIAQGQGKVVNIASVAGKIAFPGSVCYASTKFALTGFSEGMAAELSGQGIDVVTVCPGLVRTEFFKNNRNAQDVTQMATKPTLYGWVLRNIISISSEQAAKEILAACEKGGSSEIVLTAPGVFMERLAGVWPPLVFQLSKLVPADRGPGPARTGDSSTAVD